MKAAKGKVEVYKDLANKWRWVAKTGNHRKVASSGESFFNRASAKRSAAREAAARGWPMVVVE